jgi:hypothetical protein
MKITIDIDCTPQEARAFFGLPNIEPMQDALIAKMQERLAESMSAMEPDALMRLWFPGGLQGLGQLQERFWSQLFESAAVPGGPGRSKKKE